MSDHQEFPFAFVPAYRRAGMIFGVTPRTARVRVEAGELRVRFGPWSLRTPLGNVASVQHTGGFAFLKTAGPPHLSFADRGITFATNGDRALCVAFHQPVKGIDPSGLIRHPAATLTVTEPEALAAALGLG